MTGARVQALADERRVIEAEEGAVRIASTPRHALRRQALIADEEVKVSNYGGKMFHYFSTLSNANHRVGSKSLSESVTWKKQWFTIEVQGIMKTSKNGFFTIRMTRFF